MSRLHKFLNNESCADFLVTFLLATGLSSVCCVGFFPVPNVLHVYLWCALFALALCMWGAWKFRLKGLLLLAALSATALAGVFLHIGPVHALIEAVKAFIYLKTGWTEILTVYADMILPIFCLLITMIAFGASADESGFSAALFTVGACTVMFLLMPDKKMLAYALPAFIGLMIQWSRKQHFTILALPVALLIALAAFFITPQTPKTSPSLEQMAAKVQQFIEDHLMFTQQRTSFSLAADGYLPLEVRLGGKPNVSERSVMNVKTPETVLLRGKTYDYYTGISWEDTLSAKRYLYHSLYSRELRTTLFGLDRPAADLTGIPLQEVQVELLSDGTTTLFAPARTREIQMQGERMVLYFNTAGEMFLTRETAKGDTYSLSHLPLHAGHANTARLISACAQLEDPYFDTVRSQYLTLPSHIQQELFDIAAQAVDENATPYEKALQLQAYLKTHYRYSLDVETPPENVDFAAYFLLGEKKGYCTYFATAMTVLCRINGIPARYVTGYLAQPGEDGVAHVQGKNAHAWTEIYLKGFGWLPIDATGSADTPENHPDGQTPPQSATPTPQPSLPPTATPSPSAPPTQVPTQTPPDAPTQSPPPAQSTLPPTPAPSHAPSPSPGADGTDRQQEENHSAAALAIWLILLVLAALVLRWHFTRPETRARRKNADPARVYYGATEMLLSQYKLRRAPQETLHAFAQRCHEAGFTGAAQSSAMYAAHVYGNKQADVPFLRSQYRALLQASSLPRKAYFPLRCMLGKT